MYIWGEELKSENEKWVLNKLILKKINQSRSSMTSDRFEDQSENKKSIRNQRLWGKKQNKCRSNQNKEKTMNGSKRFETVLNDKKKLIELFWFKKEKRKERDRNETFVFCLFKKCKLKKP